MNVNSLNKKTYLEIMRAIAIIFVLFNHSLGFTLFFKFNPWSFNFFTALILSLFCRFAVPLFFMISGALTLKRNYSVKDLINKFLLFASILVIWSAVYYIRDRVIHHLPWYTWASCKEFIKTLYSKNHSPHLWFLYAYLAFIASIPFLQSMCSKLENRWFKFMAVIGTGFSILAMLEYALFRGSTTINPNIKPKWMLYMMFFYPCLGYYLDHRISTKNIHWNKIILLWVLNFAILLLGAYVTTLKSINLGSPTEVTPEVFHFDMHASIICAPVIFVSIKKLFAVSEEQQVKPVETKLLTMLKWIGNNSFGIYLLHLLIQDLACMKNLYFCVLHRRIFFHHMISVLFFVVILTFICGLITSLLRRIPVIRRLI